ncbi:hypothetical protein [Kitasatospora sp. NPDC091207]|uniref:hypothetical protein n=1 Tax=Kitasatospora sp. NPDC091207 TaxID=3364083 RepID=UPI00382042B5
MGEETPGLLTAAGTARSVAVAGLPQAGLTHAGPLRAGLTEPGPGRSVRTGTLAAAAASVPSDRVGGAGPRRPSASSS